MADSKHYVVIDCDRKALLRLPSGALRLWLTYYMQERDSQESWLSLRKIQEIMGMSQPTIIKWQRYLKENGWLVETGETAADKYSNPTPGAHKVPVVRVDDGAKVSLPPKGGAKVSLPPKNFSKASSSGSAYASPSESRCSYQSDSESGSGLIAAHLLEAAEAKAKPKATATESSSEPSLVQPVQSSLSAGAVPAKPPCRPLKDKRVAKDGTPWPENFDSLSQPDKVCWLMEHDPTPGVKIQLAVYRASLKPEPEEEIDVAAYIEEEDEVTRRLAWLRSRGIVIEDTRTR
jgi:hypothetical protein